MQTLSSETTEEHVSEVGGSVTLPPAATRRALWVKSILMSKSI